MFREPRFSVAVVTPKGNHLDVDIPPACPSTHPPADLSTSSRAPGRGWVRSATVTDRRAPDDQVGRGRPPGRSAWARVAAAVCLVHAVLLVGLAGFYGLELMRGEGSSTVNVVLSLALILVFAALLAALARVWWVGSTRALVPTVVWNGLLVPVVIALYGAEDRLVAGGLLLLVVLGIGTALAASRRARPVG